MNVKLYRLGSWAHARRVRGHAADTVYASLQTTARDKEAFDGGVYRSEDAGKTWRAVNGVGMPRRVGSKGQSPYMTSQIKELAVDPRDPNVVYAGNLPMRIRVGRPLAHR